MSAGFKRLPTNAEALAELITAGGVRYERTRRSYIFDCPRCGKPKLHMFRDDGRFVCWVCRETEGFAGRPEFALSEIYGRPVGELRRLLYGTEVPQGFSHAEFRLRDFWSEDESPDPDAFELAEVSWPHDFYGIDHKFSARGRKYLEARGVGLELARRYDLRYCPPERRVVFPIQRGGRLFGWQARSTIPTEYEDPATLETRSIPKIVTTTGLRKEYALIFWDRLDGSGHAVVAEGPFDAIKCDLCGGNVGMGGKAVSRQQVGLLRNSGVTDVYLALDPDASDETRRLLCEFHDLRTWVMEPPPHREDFGACTLDEAAAAYRTSRRLVAGQVYHRLSFPTVEDFARGRRDDARRERYQRRRGAR